MKTRVWTIAAALAGCVPQAATTVTHSEAGTDATGAASEATAEAPTTNGTTGAPAQCETFPPYRIDVQAEPNGLYYRVDEQRLYIADDDANRVLVRDEDGATEVFAEIPNPSGDPGSDGLGDLDFAGDGTLYLPRFGFGMPGLGAIFRVAPGGSAEALAGVNDE